MKQVRQENVGVLDAYIRVSGGLLLLALATFGRFGRLASWTMFAAGASSVASGVTRYCPITEALAIAGIESDVHDEAEGATPRSFPWEGESAGSSPGRSQEGEHESYSHGGDADVRDEDGETDRGSGTRADAGRGNSERTETGLDASPLSPATTG